MCLYLKAYGSQKFDVWNGSYSAGDLISLNYAPNLALNMTI